MPRHSRALAVVWLAVLAAPGCLDAGAFACSDDSNCEAGTCFDGHCAFEDGLCESGLRFDPLAVSGVAGQCVPPTNSTSSGSVETSPTPDASTTTTTGSEESTTTAPTDDTSSTTSDPTTTETTGEPACDVDPCPCAQQIAAGSQHNCALRNDGSVVCWGRNQDGQLGTGQVTGADPWPHVVPLPDDALIVSIDASWEHSCALAMDGRAWCWGRNDNGEIDPDDGSSVLPPTQLAGLPPLVALKVGRRFTCGVDGMGQFACWGYNNRFQLLATGPSGALHTSGPHLDAPLDGHVLGREHGCAWEGTTLRCWGDNDSGQLAVPRLGRSEVPLDVSLDATAVIAAAAGSHHTCVATNGGDTVLCWGGNGQLQVSSEEGTQPTPTPVPIDGLGNVVHIDARSNATCVVFDTAELYCWGGDDGGDYGTNTPNGADLFPPARVVVLDEIPEPPVEVAVGDEHLCVRSASERMWCWGRDNFEQLGGIDPIAGMATVEIDLECQ